MSLKNQIKLLCLVILFSFGCASTPSNLLPKGIEAFNKTRLIKGLDVLRDTAISANETIPPLVSTATTRKIVQYHRSALVVINTNGVIDITSASLDELMKNLPQNESNLLKPYVELAKLILREVTE